MSPVALALLPSTLTALYIIVLYVERKSGHRYGARMRVVFDRVLDEVNRAFGSHMPDVNHQFVRQLFHYVVHLGLSLILWMLGLIERGLRRILRLNRTKAVTGTPLVSTDSHLRKIAEHKEESALTEKEKTARKKAALRGDV